MSRTTIEWTDYSWNPMRGCSPKMRCAPTCWAEKMAHRHRNNPKYAGFTRVNKCGPEWSGKVALIEDELTRPFRWRTPRRIAVALMGDWMRLPLEDIDRIIAVEARCPQHYFLHLTKCPQELLEYAQGFGVVDSDLRPPFGPVPHAEGLLAALVRWPLPNLWLGVSCLDQADADAAREPMRQLAAAGWRTWVSHEPAWGGIDWEGWELIRFMASGGQTGPKSRPSHPDWFRADRDFCARNGIPWMFKQWGAWRDRRVGDPERGKMIRLTRLGRNGQDLANSGDGGDVWMQRVGRKAAGRLLDGREHLALPEVTHA